MLDDDFTVDATLAEGGGIGSPPRPAPTGASHDYRALYERERARAQARCKEWRWAEVAARSDAGSWKARLKSCRRKLDAAVEQTTKLRREVKAGAPGLHREVTRLRKALSQALAEPSAAATQARKHRLAALEAENLQLRKTVKAAKAGREAAPTSSPSCAAACPPTGSRDTPPRPCSSRRSSKRPATPAPSTGPAAGPTSEPPRAGGATTGTRSSTSPARTSGSGPCDAIGGAHSIGKILAVVGLRVQPGG